MRFKRQVTREYKLINGDLEVTGALIGPSFSSMMASIGQLIANTQRKDVIIVASSTYQGTANYHCDGTADQVQINAAIVEANSYGGATVQLTEGVFTLSGYISIPYSYITLEGREGATEIKFDGTHRAIRAVGVGDLDAIVIRQLRITATAVPSTQSIYCENLYYSTIEKIHIVSYDVGIHLNGFWYGNIAGNTVYYDLAPSGAGTHIGINANAAGSCIANNIIYSYQTSGSIYGIQVEGTDNIILCNLVYSLSSTGAAANAIGLCILATYCNAIGNHVLQVLNSTTAANAYGIYILNAETHVASNHCYGNGLDAGYANTNNRNCYDSSGSARKHANTWQATPSSFVETLLDDTTASAFLTTLGVSAFVQTLLNDADAITARQTLACPSATMLDLDSADYTVLDNDGYGWIRVTTGAANRTITLPTAADNVGREIVILKADTGVGSVIVDGEGAEYVGYGASLTFDLYWSKDYVVVRSTGARWEVIGTKPPELVYSSSADVNASTAPVSGTWYNPTNHSLSLAIGAWEVSASLIWRGLNDASAGANMTRAWGCLSSANNSASYGTLKTVYETNYTGYSVWAGLAGASTTATYCRVPMFIGPYILYLASAITLYLNVRVDYAGGGVPDALGTAGTLCDSVIRARRIG